MPKLLVFVVALIAVSLSLALATPADDGDLHVATRQPHIASVP